MINEMLNARGGAGQDDDVLPCFRFEVVGFVFRVVLFDSLFL